jgi:hypothetical protein
LATQGRFDTSIDGVVIGDAFGHVMTDEHQVGQWLALVEQDGGAGCAVVA